MKILWTGSDTLFQIKFPPGIRFRFKVKILIERIVMRIVSIFVQEHYVDHKFLKYHLLEKGYKNIRVVPDKMQHDKSYPKIEHKGFNILFYYPKGKKNKEFIRWLYGIDIYERLRDELNGVNWIVVNGDSDMSKIYPVTDFYLRPTRHDGASRMRQECEIQKIPYYWSQENPDIEEIKEEIDRCRLKLL